jgi:hypothetical protein
MSELVPEPTPESTQKLTAEEVISQVRTMGSRIGEIEVLSQQQRRRLKQRLRKHVRPVVEASINVIGMLDNVSQAIGQPLDDVRQLQDDALRWNAAADEVRAFLKRIECASLLRQERLTRIAAQAYSIGSQLAQDPAKAVILPHVEEVQRLKRLARRKKTAPAPEPPAAPPPAPEP